MHQAQTTLFPATPTRRRGVARRRALRRGQSIVVALLVLLLLGLAGALFVTIVARNLLNARHAARTVTADQYARAGITFADAQLTNSMDGADWRPPLQNTLLAPPTEARELARYTNAVAVNSLSAPDPTDPDAKYLEAGFARYNTGAGRFLLRLTYTPVLIRDTPNGPFYDPVFGNSAPVAVPPGKYIKIESIGREGVIDPRDPTTYGNNRSSDRLQSYQVAYQPIGITDYARFETNPDNRSTTADMGVTSRFYAQDTDGGIITPGAYDFNSSNVANAALQQYPILTTYGAPDAYLYSSAGGPLLPNPNAGTATAIGPTTTALPGGGSFHANMPVRFFGKNVVYLNDAGTDAPLYQDSMETAGDLLLNGYKAGTSIDNTGVTSGGQIAALIMNPPDLATLKTNGTNGTFIVPSNDPTKFSTQFGRIRDGSSQTDINGLPRSIGRLEPPHMDATEPATQLPRYKAIATTSSPRGNLMTTDGKAYTPPAGDFTASRYGYGRSIYIDNTQDVQPESTSIGGGSTLVDEWLNRTEPASGTAKGDWNGNFYDPPGVSIILGQLIKPAGPNNVPPAVYGIRLVRGAGTPNWVGPDGNGNAGPVLDIPYSDLDNDPTGNAADNDIVIYAEGNVRIHGILSPNEGTTAGPNFVPRHITIVTNATAYIEGNLLKGNPDSSISVLAHDYACVNTTQFLAGPNVADGTNGFQYAKANGLADFPGVSFLDLTDGVTLLQEFNFGLTGGNTTSGKYGTSPLALYLSASPDTTSASGGASADINILDSSGQSVLSTTAPFPAVPPFSQFFGALTHTTVDLSGSTASLLNASGADLFHLSIQKSPGTEGATAQQNVELERVAVLPMDIRIEAVLYAQTRSFFVIPGDWFNTSPSDTLDKFVPGTTRPDQEYVTDTNLTTAQNNSLANDRARFPFYGQPIDMKITVDGSVSEAQPVDVADQTAWMLKWGWIPQYHGSAASASAPTALEPAGHVLQDANKNPSGKPAIGLQIIYNPQAGYPYSPASQASSTSPAVAAHYLRSDPYGRPLPFSPKLPVSTALLFTGQSSEPPLLQ